METKQNELNPEDNPEMEEYSDENISVDDYTIWKKNSPYLYDVLMTFGLDWPSLTINFIPNNKIEKFNFYQQKMVLGTHTSGQESEYLMIAKTRLPQHLSSLSKIKDNNPILINQKQQENNNNININNNINNNTNIPPKIECKFEIEVKILHDGEVNRAKIIPDYANKNEYRIIATQTSKGNVDIYDYFKRQTNKENKIPKPDIRLNGHTKEGYGLSWSKFKQGYLISGNYDKKLCLHDIENSEPILTYEEHLNNIEDVCFNNIKDNIFISCGDDKRLILYDYREKKPTKIVENAHEAEINSCDFNNGNEFILLTASSDKTCALWDIRNLDLKLHTFYHHKDSVYGVKWNKKLFNVFASFGDDKKINIWDISQIGASIATTDNEDGASELIFTHCGHTNTINDIDWNDNEELMIASTSDDNVIQFWEMDNNVYYGEKD